MDEIKFGLPPSMEVPPEPPQKRAEELGETLRREKRENRRRGFELKQPPKKEEEKEIKQASPEEAKAAAVKLAPRVPVQEKGKINKKKPKGRVRPL